MHKRNGTTFLGSLLVSFSAVAFLAMAATVLWGTAAQGQQPSCTDSDNSPTDRLGADRRTRGTTTNRANNTTRRDSCDPADNRLVEYFCADANTLRARLQFCPGDEYCYNGVCRALATGNREHGTACVNGNQCRSGICDGPSRTCRGRGNRARCTSGLQCASLACVGTTWDAALQMNVNGRCGLLPFGEVCSQDQQCESNRCIDEPGCVAQGAPCRRVCGKKGIGTRCENSEECDSANCDNVPIDPSLGGSSTGGEGASCHRTINEGPVIDEIEDEIPPCHPSICGEPQPAEDQTAPGAAEAPPQAAAPECIKVCRASFAHEVADSGRCSSHAPLYRDADRAGDGLEYECQNSERVCRPWISRRTREFYSIHNKYCSGKVRSTDGCWYNIHCQSGVCSNGRCQ